MEKVQLNFGGVRYASDIDEQMFFDWLSKIKSIVKIEGKGRDLFVYFSRKDINEQDLRELIALCNRYHVNMKQLEVFLNKKNQAWLKDKSAFWYRKIFPLGSETSC